MPTICGRCCAAKITIWGRRQNWSKSGRGSNCRTPSRRVRSTWSTTTGMARATWTARGWCSKRPGRAAEPRSIPDFAKLLRALTRSHAGLRQLLPRRLGRAAGHRQPTGQLHSQRRDQPDDHSRGRGPETSLLVLPPGAAGIRPAARSGRVAVPRAAGRRTGRHPAGMVHAGPSRELLAVAP